MSHPYPAALHCIKHMRQVYLWDSCPDFEKGRRYYTARAADAAEAELLRHSKFSS